MRISYIVAVAGLLAAAPAIAQVVVTTPDSGAAAAHDYNAHQDREAGHQAIGAARANAAVGNYDAAAQDQDAARHYRHAAHHEEHKADRDSTGSVVLHIH